MTKAIVVWLITTNRDDVITYQNTMKKVEIKLNIQIDLKIVSWVRLYDSLVEAFREGNQPDLFALGTTWIATFAHLGYLEPVPENLGFAPALASWMDVCSCFNGIKYAIPYNVSPLIICARKNYLEQNQITKDDLKTFEDLYNSCIRINENNKSLGNNENIPFTIPIKADVNSMHYFFSFLYETGWRFPDLTSKNDFNFDTEEFYKIFLYMNSLMSISGNQPQVLQLDNNQIYDKFYSFGQVTMYMDYSNRIVSNIMDEKINGKKVNRSITIIPLPSNKENGKMYLGGSMLAVAANSQHKELAWEIIKILIDDEAIELDSLLSGNLPALNTNFWKKYGEDPEINILYQEIKKSASYPFHPLWRSIEEILADGIYRAFLSFHHEHEVDTYMEVVKILDDTTKKIRNLLDLSWEI